MSMRRKSTEIEDNILIRGIIRKEDVVVDGKAENRWIPTRPFWTERQSAGIERVAGYLRRFAVFGMRLSYRHRHESG